MVDDHLKEKNEEKKWWMSSLQEPYITSDQFPTISCVYHFIDVSFKEGIGKKLR